MSHQPSILEQLIGVLRLASGEGSPAAGLTEEEHGHIAQVALRRIRSFNRRGVPPGDHRRQVADLAKGFVAQFERKPDLVGPLLMDYEHIAELILAAHSGAADHDT